MRYSRAWYQDKISTINGVIGFKVKCPQPGLVVFEVAVHRNISSKTIIKRIVNELKLKHDDSCCFDWCIKLIVPHEDPKVVCRKDIV